MRAVIVWERITKTGTLEEVTNVPLYDWKAQYYTSWQTPLSYTDLSQNTSSEKNTVIIRKLIRGIQKNDIVTLFDTYWDEYWKYEVLNVAVRRSITWYVSNTHLSVKEIYG